MKCSSSIVCATEGAAVHMTVSSTYKCSLACMSLPTSSIEIENKIVSRIEPGGTPLVISRKSELWPSACLMF